MPFGVNTKVSLDSKSLCFASAFNNAGNRLVTGGDDSTVRVYYLEGGTLRQSAVSLTVAMTEKQELKMPITALRFRSNDPNNLLTVATCDGAISLWHLGALKMVHSFREKDDNGTYAADYCPNGSLLATGGTDGVVRLYDADQNYSLSSELSNGPNALQPRAHTSRIQSVRFVDASVLLTAGWDRIVNIWDTRAGGGPHHRPVGALHAPYMCGDGLDVRGNTVVCASSERLENQLELFDLRSMSLLHAVTLPANEETGQAPSLYAARFAPSDPLVVAVGGARYAGLYNIRNNAFQAEPVGQLDAEESAVFSTSWDPKGNQCFFGGKRGRVVQRI